MIVKMNARRLVPLDRYTKPLAKIDSNSFKEIAQQEARISQLEADLASFQSELGIPGNIPHRRNILKAHIDKTIQKINSLRDYIRSVKAESYRNQLLNQ
jgi:hypothetical protein